jgi:hypothetical protein
MSETLSLSIFTIEADHTPVLAFSAKRFQEAETFCADERVLSSQAQTGQLGRRPTMR